MNIDNKKDDVNTILTALIVLLIIAVFLPPLFRYIYSDGTSSVSTSTTQVFTCAREENITTSIREQIIKEIIKGTYDNNTIKVLEISFDYPESLTENDLAVSQFVDIEKDNISRYAASMGIAPITNKTVVSYSFPVGQKPEFLQNSVIQSYADAKTFENQKQQLIEKGFKCE